MPFTANAGARLHWQGDGQLSGPPLLLLNSIGTDLGSWDSVMPYLLPHFHVLRMDVRGHGASDAPVGEYSLGLLADDALAVLDAGDVGQAAICGVSLGGMVAMQAALQAPTRVRALIAACTSPRMEPEMWRLRIAAIEAGGTAAIAEQAIGRFVSASFARIHPEVVDRLRATLLSQPAHGYTGCGAAIRDMDLRGRLAEIAVPTLVISAEKDVSTPHRAHGRLIANSVPGARTARLAAAHLAQVEEPSAFAAALIHFLGSLGWIGQSEESARRC